MTVLTTWSTGADVPSTTAFAAPSAPARPTLVRPVPGASAPTLAIAPLFDIERVLASIDTMATHRPVAARIVSVANADGTSAKELSQILASDVGLAGRVMKLSNSAYFGMRGRVTSLSSR
jgi:hypothetical protein